jgi:hypothetical protein
LNTSRKVFIWASNSDTYTGYSLKKTDTLRMTSPMHDCSPQLSTIGRNVARKSRCTLDSVSSDAGKMRRRNSSAKTSLR